MPKDGVAVINAQTLVVRADARSLPLPDSCVDLVVTSPPYYRKRDYENTAQIGQEQTPGAYIAQLSIALTEMWRVLRATGSAFLNIGDSYNQKRSLIGIPGLVERAAQHVGWRVRNRIVWTKSNGMPSPVRNRLVNRHEFILHLAKGPGYYYDLHGYLRSLPTGSGPADVWAIPLVPSQASHLAPFPDELVRRAIALACPSEVCSQCHAPRRRRMRKTRRLDRSRQQARRAVEIARESGLTKAHIAAIQATGIADAGKGRRIQGEKNTREVRALAAEAKEALGGYFREFTFPKWESSGFSRCSCGAPFGPGIVLDPFAGSGTTLRVAASEGRAAIGVDVAAGQSPLDE